MERLREGTGRLLEISRIGKIDADPLLQKYRVAAGYALDRLDESEAAACVDQMVSDARSIPGMTGKAYYDLAAAAGRVFILRCNFPQQEELIARYDENCSQSSSIDILFDHLKTLQREQISRLRNGCRGDDPCGDQRQGDHQPGGAAVKSEVFRMERVTYQEGGIRKLRDCELNIFSGEILGLIPLNSYGLQALMDVMTKNLPLQFGFVFLKEKLINHWQRPNPRNNPIGLIQSKSHLVEGMTLSENVFVLRSGFRAMVAGYRLVVLQDFSTFLNESELEKIHTILRQCASEGISFLYIGSQPEDISRIADRVAIFGNGRILKNVEAGTSLQEILEKAAAGKFAAQKERTLAADSQAVFRGVKLRLAGVEEVSFSVHPGECVVLQDVSNRFIPQILEILMGEREAPAGSLWLGDAPFSSVSDRKTAIIQELPTQTMIFPRMSYFDNLFLTSDHHLPGLWRKLRMQRRLAQEFRAREEKDLFDQSVESLSELEKYDLVYNRILFQKPEVVFCVRPFKGADMELREHIRHLITLLQKKQIAVVLLTTNASEAFGIADRMIRIG